MKGLNGWDRGSTGDDFGIKKGVFLNTGRKVAIGIDSSFHLFHSFAALGFLLGNKLIKVGRAIIDVIYSVSFGNKFFTDRRGGRAFNSITFRINDAS